MAETDSTSEASILERLENIIEPPAAAPAKKPAAPPPPGDDGELEALADEPDPLEPEPADSVPPEDAVEIELDNGEKRRLTKAELKDIHSQATEYKQTAAIINAQRQAIETERKIAADIMQMAPQREAIRAEGRMLAQAMDRLNQEVRTLTETDPIAAFQKQQQVNQLQSRFNQLAQADAQVDGQLRQLQTLQFQQQIAAELPVLIAKLPKWRDPEKMKSDTQFIRTHLKAEGYPDYEINALTQSRYVITALKAAKYDAITKAKASRKMDGAPQLATPGTRPLPGQAAATERNQYRKQVQAARTDAEKAKIIQKRLERIL
jgi:hypothetical protein